MQTRRQFLTKAGATVTLLMIPVGCSSSSSPAGSPNPDAGSGSCNGTLSTSTNVGMHTHTLCVPATDLASPPSGGATYTSSVNPDPFANNQQHSHTVMLTAAQLTGINSGTPATVTSSVNVGHTHDFTIMKM